VRKFMGRGAHFAHRTASAGLTGQRKVNVAGNGNLARQQMNVCNLKITVIIKKQQIQSSLCYRCLRKAEVLTTKQPGFQGVKLCKRIPANLCW
jgi:hypothetical protein